LAAVAVGGCVAAMLALVGRLDPSLLRLQSGRWAAWRLAVGAGFVSQAGLAYESWPSGRATRSSSPGGRWWSRAVALDFLGLGRTGLRTAACGATLVFAGVWLGRAVAAVLGEPGGSPNTWALVAASASVLASVGAGGLTGGLAHVVDDAKSPSSYGVDQGPLAGVHAVAPLSLICVSLAAGAGAGVFLAPRADAFGVFPGPGAWALWPLVVVLVATAVALVAAQVLERAKGASPDALATPMYSPMGDPAPLLRAAWQIWPQLLVMGWGAGCVLAFANLGHPGGSACVAAGAAAVVWWSLRRLRSL
jgi:hypothetical protein